MPSLLSCFFFSLLPPPPRPTLFPYTTLFRSGAARSPSRGPPSAGEWRSGSLWPFRLSRRCSSPSPRTGNTEDRKSTRLNSSHDQISYAVFCLKKKKNTHHIAHENHTT